MMAPPVPHMAILCFGWVQYSLWLPSPHSTRSCCLVSSQQLWSPRFPATVSSVSEVPCFCLSILTWVLDPVMMHMPGAYSLLSRTSELSGGEISFLNTIFYHVKNFICTWQGKFIVLFTSYFCSYLIQCRQILTTIECSGHQLHQLEVLRSSCYPCTTLDYHSNQPDYIRLLSNIPSLQVWKCTNPGHW